MCQLGHLLPRMVYVDNPSASMWLYDAIDSLNDYQEKLDEIAEQINTANHDNRSVDDTDQHEIITLTPPQI